MSVALLVEHPTGEGKLYLCAIKDCASNRIVGHSIRPRMTSDVAARALRNPIALRSPQQLLAAVETVTALALNRHSLRLDTGAGNIAHHTVGEPEEWPPRALRTRVHVGRPDQH